MRPHAVLEERGQMTVELAVVVPVVVVMALVVFDLMRFVALCARFDRVSLDAVVSQGISPPWRAGRRLGLSTRSSVPSRPPSRARRG
ncbi:MAG: pilus assembly protein [Atopobiaceae bacterium]|jgi:hypothetical protein|nr:pilus assembly protein [Atopobiaceae bacterium]